MTAAAVSTRWQRGGRSRAPAQGARPFTTALRDGPDEIERCIRRDPPTGYGRGVPQASNQVRVPLTKAKWKVTGPVSPLNVRSIWAV